jgi:uncharacterized protein YkwD
MGLAFLRKYFGAGTSKRAGRTSGARNRRPGFEPLEHRLLLSFDPSGVEQEVLFDLNRMRCNPQGELGVLFSSISPTLTAVDPDVESALAYYNDPTSTEIQTDWPKLQAAAPLAWNASLYSAATAHSQLMITDDTQSHQLAGEQTFDVRDANAGYTNESYGGENIDGYGTNGFNIHSAFAIDYGNAGTSYGHRTNMMNSEYHEVGIAVVTDTRTGVTLGPLVATEDFGARFDQGNPFLVGVAYNDANHNGRYDAGEGLSGVTIQITGTGGTFTTTTMSAGGYQIQLPAGSYTVTASGGSLTSSSSVSVVVQSANVEADFLSGLSTGYVNFVQANSATVGRQIIDNSQPGFWSSSYTTWTTGTGLDGSSQISSTANGSKQSMAAWWYSVPAGVYDISVTYTAASNLTAKLGLDLYDGVGHWIGQAVVNEQTAPTDFSDQGVGWRHVCTVKLTHNIFHISTWNSPTDGAIEVNGIQLRAVPMVDDTSAGTITGSGGLTLGGTWTAATQGAFGTSQVSSSTAGSGASTATWTMPITAGSYTLGATWVAASSLSAGVTYKIYDGSSSTPLASVVVDQQATPADVYDEGVAWKSLGTYTFSSTSIRVVVANSAADGQVCADALRILPAYQPVAIVDNDGPGFWASGSSTWTTVAQGVYGDALVSSSTPGSKSSQAAWWFPVRPGTYDIQVSWPVVSGLSATVGFDLYDGLKWKGQVKVNQQTAPSGTTDQGATWQDLGDLTVTTNNLHLSTWNLPTDGAICADAVRIVWVSGS